MNAAGSSIEKPNRTSMTANGVTLTVRNVWTLHDTSANLFTPSSNLAVEYLCRSTPYIFFRPLPHQPQAGRRRHGDRLPRA